MGPNYAYIDQLRSIKKNQKLEKQQRKFTNSANQQMGSNDLVLKQ